MARLHKLSQEFNTALDRCASVAGVAEVHHVRTTAQRVRATVEGALRRHSPSEIPLKKAGADWLRQMKKLRRAAGPVRDLDVQRKLLEGAASDAYKLDGGPVYGQSTAAPGADSIAEEINSLDVWLGDRRHVRAGVLVREIRKRREKLAACEAAFFAASEKCGTDCLGETASACKWALEDFAQATEAMPSLNTENLHSFRKRAKAARYIAESGGPDAAGVARVLKRIQDAAGEWHDWLGLSAEANAAPGGRAPQLAAWLKGNLNRSLGRALRAASEGRARLLAEWSLMNGADPDAIALEKYPPSRAVQPVRNIVSQPVRNTVSRSGAA